MPIATGSRESDPAKVAGNPRAKEPVKNDPSGGFRDSGGPTFVPPWRDLTPRGLDPLPDPKIPVGSGGGGTVDSGNDTGGGGGGDGESSPFDRLADGFLAALGGGVSQPEDTTPYIVSDPNAGAGSGMQLNFKTIAIVVAIAAGAWFLWKRYGKKAVSAASGGNSNAA